MSNIENFNELFTYLEDKPTLDVTEAMGFDPTRTQFKLVTMENTSIQVRRRHKPARVIGLVVNNLAVLDSESSDITLTELFATDNGKVTSRYRHEEKSTLGTNLEDTIIPKVSSELAHQSAISIVQDAYMAHRIIAEPDWERPINSEADNSNIPIPERRNEVSIFAAAQRKKAAELQRSANRLKRDESKQSTERVEEFAKIMIEKRIPYSTPMYGTMPFDGWILSDAEPGSTSRSGDNDISSRRGLGVSAEGTLFGFFVKVENVKNSSERHYSIVNTGYSSEYDRYFAGDHGLEALSSHVNAAKSKK